MPGFDPISSAKRIFRPLSIAASGLSAQRTRMETIANNIANAETTRTAEGGPYQRQVVQLAANAHPDRAFSNGPSLDLNVPALPFQNPDGGVSVVGSAQDTRDSVPVYDPGHPDADEMGYVRYPNVEISQETVEMMIAQRTYEANATVFQVLKAVLHKALEI
jgi:flagellar basal-body rod protein FlgC